MVVTSERHINARKHFKIPPLKPQEAFIFESNGPIHPITQRATLSIHPPWLLYIPVWHHFLHSEEQQLLSDSPSSSSRIPQSFCLHYHPSLLESRSGFSRLLKMWRWGNEYSCFCVV